MFFFVTSIFYTKYNLDFFDKKKNLKIYFIFEVWDVLRIEGKQIQNNYVTIKMFIY
jgi:hypothetical protein